MQAGTHFCGFTGKSTPENMNKEWNLLGKGTDDADNEEASKPRGIILGIVPGLVSRVPSKTCFVSTVSRETICQKDDKVAGSAGSTREQPRCSRTMAEIVPKVVAKKIKITKVTGPVNVGQITRVFAFSSLLLRNAASSKTHHSLSQPKGWLAGGWVEGGLVQPLDPHSKPIKAYGVAALPRRHPRAPAWNLTCQAGQRG